MVRCDCSHIAASNLKLRDRDKNLGVENRYSHVSALTTSFLGLTRLIVFFFFFFEICKIKELNDGTVGRIHGIEQQWFLAKC